MDNRNQQSRWATFAGRRVGALQLSQADRLARSRAAAQQRRDETAAEVAGRAPRGRNDG